MLCEYFAKDKNGAADAAVCHAARAEEELEPKIPKT